MPAARYRGPPMTLANGRTTSEGKAYRPPAGGGGNRMALSTIRSLASCGLGAGASASISLPSGAGAALFFEDEEGG